MTDETAWIDLARQGDEKAFTLLVEKYQKPVYNLCYRMLGGSEAAEDAAQETFLRVYQALARYDPARSFATWLLSIAAHYCIDTLRRRRLFTLSIEAGEGLWEPSDPSAPNPETKVAGRQEREHLQDCLKTLTPTDRLVVVLRYWQDYSEGEIAWALNLSVPAVKGRLYRARRRLAQVWEPLSPCKAGAQLSGLHSISAIRKGRRDQYGSIHTLCDRDEQPRQNL